MLGRVSYLTFASLLGSAECAVIAVIFESDPAVQSL